MSWFSGWPQIPIRLKPTDSRAGKLPPLEPSEHELHRWASSEWVEYQAWLFHHGFLCLTEWRALRAEAEGWGGRAPLISLLTPVFNTPADYLRECVRSVLLQTYPRWELCLVNDGSDQPETLRVLSELAESDPRLRIIHLEANRGICRATNRALDAAGGQYVGFLDHDDCLAPDALHRVAALLMDEPDTDIVYSDRDMLSPEGHRFMHLFKPDWSPETLLSGNYLFHLLVYRRQLLVSLGGVREGFEGSQDYDLILRAAEQRPRVKHISRVLYHWRQHRESVALEHNSKRYAYEAGLRALRESLSRRGIEATVMENPDLWRGHYRLRLPAPPAEKVAFIRIAPEDPYAATINQAVRAHPEADFFVILDQHAQAVGENSLDELLGWLRLPGVGLSSGQVVDEIDQLLHAGLVHRPNGLPLSLYAGHPRQIPGYMAVTAIVRNVAAPSPHCCAMSRSLWEQLGGLKECYRGPHALLDLALRALRGEQRIVYIPFARFQARGATWPAPESWPSADRPRFAVAWRDWLTRGDPYYNRWLTLELNDMGLDMQAWRRERPRPELNSR